MAALTFDGWLCDKLKTLNTDHEVFGTYITSILEGDETEEEKREALEGIFGEEIGISDLCNEILNQWTKFQATKTNEENKAPGMDMDAKIASIMEQQAKSVITERQLTTEEKQLREVILAQYSEVSEDHLVDDDDPGGADSAISADGPLLVRNVNTDAVASTEREKREKNKIEHEKKKAQDKLNREKQKQQLQERKDKEKKRTQKGERKR